MLRISRWALLSGVMLVLGSVVAFVVYGAEVCFGYFFGGAFALGSLLATRAVIRRLDIGRRLPGVAGLQALFLAKTVAFVIVLFFTYSLGLGALYGLLGGYVLVYLAAFGGLLGRRPAPVSSDKET